MLVPAALAIESGEALDLLGQSIFVSGTRRSPGFLVLRLTWDGVFAVLGMLAIDGSRAHRLFVPLVNVGLLHVPPPVPETGWRALAADRGLLAALLAFAAEFDFVDGGLMLLALLLLALRIVAPGERS